MASIRLPWHMDPGSFPRFEWLGAAAAIAVLVVTIRDPLYAPLRRLLLVVAAGCVVATIGLVVGSSPVVSLQFFRVTPLVPIVLACIAGDGAADLLGPGGRMAPTALADAAWARRILALAILMTAMNQRWPGDVILVGLAPLLLVPRALNLARVPGRGRWIVTLVIALAAIVANLGAAVAVGDLRVVTAVGLGCAAWFATGTIGYGARGRGSRRHVSVGLGAAVAIALILVMAVNNGVPGPIRPFVGQLAARAEPQDDLDRLAAWAGAALPPGSLVLVPPSEPGWRFWSSLPEVADFKSFPYGDVNVVEWLDRIERVSGATIPARLSGVSDALRLLDTAYRSERPQALGAVARRYASSFVVMDAGSLAGCAPLRVEGSWGIVAVGDSCMAPPA
jgi:hypothetical protein